MTEVQRFNSSLKSYSLNVAIFANIGGSIVEMPPRIATDLFGVFFVNEEDPSSELEWELPQYSIESFKAHLGAKELYIHTEQVEDGQVEYSVHKA